VGGQSGAVYGVAAWAMSRTGSTEVDVYCHPAAWSYAPRLLASLDSPAGHSRYVSKQWLAGPRDRHGLHARPN
jgi:hypothetical protein